MNLEYPKSNFEVILIDDGSDTKEQLRVKYYVAKYEKWLNISYTYIGDKNGEMRVNKARNLWVKKAKFDLLIFIDWECLVPDYYLKHYDSYIDFRDLESEIIIGDSIGYNYEDSDPIEPKEILNKNYNKYLFLPKYRDFRRIWYYQKSWHVFLGWNFCIHKDQFRNTWGWDENIISWWEDDIDFAFRIHKKWYTFSFLKRIEIYNIKDSERISREKFHSTLKNQCYVYKKYKYDVEYLEYVRQRYMNSEYYLKENNVPVEFIKMFFQSSFFTHYIDKEYIFITVNFNDKDSLPLENLKSLLERWIYINLIGLNQALFQKELLCLKSKYFFRISFCSPEYLSNLGFTHMYKTARYNKKGNSFKELQQYAPFICVQMSISDIEEMDSQWWDDLCWLHMKYISLDEIQTYIT